MATIKTQLQIQRHDLSTDKSLRAHSAADELLLKRVGALETKPKSLAIYHDRFGYLTCHLQKLSPVAILTEKSQEKAILANASANDLEGRRFSNPLSPLKKKLDYALIKAPKSLALFQVFLEHIAHNSTAKVIVEVAFMTRHFTPKLLSISNQYFENVEQSKAEKKARTITLTGKKQVPKQDIIDMINYRNDSYKQYWGVFSAKHIDYATQYFLDCFELTPEDKVILDLASGNGIIGKEIQRESPDTEIHLLEDSYLAVESAKLNIDGPNVHHHYDNDLTNFKNDTFDLIVTNPPFHFEHEINIKIPIYLFKECFRCLKPGGNLQLVSNSHLNYKTHLTKIFPSVQVLAENEKFVVYKCVK